MVIVDAKIQDNLVKLGKEQQTRERNANNSDLCTHQVKAPLTRATHSLDHHAKLVSKQKYKNFFFPI